MMEIMKSRGVDYDQAPMLKQAMDHQLQEQEEERKSELEPKEKIQTSEWQKEREQKDAERQRWRASHLEEVHKQRSERVRQ